MKSAELERLLGGVEPNGLNVTRRIVEGLGRAIVTNQFNGDAGFPFEADLCEQFGASRAIVREAVKMLTAKGLLRPRQRFGTVVRPEDSWNLLDPDVLRWLHEREFSIDLVIDFTEMRMAIEPRAASLAASSATSSQRDAIVKCADQMLIIEPNNGTVLKSYIAFHRAIIDASNNHFLQKLSYLSESAIRYAAGNEDVILGPKKIFVPYYRKISTAIIRNDSKKASALLEGMINHTLQMLMKHSNN